MEFLLNCWVVDNFPDIGTLNEQESGAVVNVIEVANGATTGDGKCYLICKIEYSDESYQLMATEI